MTVLPQSDQPDWRSASDIAGAGIAGASGGVQVATLSVSSGTIGEWNPADFGAGGVVQLWGWGYQPNATSGFGQLQLSGSGNQPVYDSIPWQEMASDRLNGLLFEATQLNKPAFVNFLGITVVAYINWSVPS